MVQLGRPWSVIERIIRWNFVIITFRYVDIGFQYDNSNFPWKNYFPTAFMVFQMELELRLLTSSVARSNSGNVRKALVFIPHDYFKTISKLACGSFSPGQRLKVKCNSHTVVCLCRQKLDTCRSPEIHFYMLQSTSRRFRRQANISMPTSAFG